MSILIVSALLIVVRRPLVPLARIHSDFAGTGAAQTAPKFIVGTAYEEGIAARKLGLSEQTLSSVEYAAWDAVLDDKMDWKPRTVEVQARLLRKCADSLTPVGASLDARAYITTYVVAAWVSSHVKYFDGGDGNSSAGEDQAGNVVSYEKRGYWIDLGKFFSCNKLSGACRHAAIVASTLVNAASSGLGVKAHYVGGWLRPEGPGLRLKDFPSNHAWIVVELPSGLRIPIDANANKKTINEWRADHLKFFPSPEPCAIIPRTREQLEVFLAHHYGPGFDAYSQPNDQLISMKSRTSGFSKDPIHSFALEEWLAQDTSSIKALRRWVYQNALKK